MIVPFLLARTFQLLPVPRVEISTASPASPAHGSFGIRGCPHPGIVAEGHARRCVLPGEGWQRGGGAGTLGGHPQKVRFCV